ncbi:MAG: ABC transporter permease [Actinomycetota bacterium]
METAKVTYALFVRSLKRTIRRPVFLSISLVQPLVWLFLFSQVMKNFGKAALPPDVPYVTLFAPAVMLQTIMFGSFQSGMAMVSDIEFGLMDKFLVAPINRTSILLGRQMADGARMFIQGAIIIVLSLLLGVHFVHGPIGVLAALLLATLFGLGLSGLSNTVALRTKNSETTLMVMNFFLFPLLFMSPALVPKGSLPHWVEVIGRGNPVAYAVEGARNLTVGIVEHGALRTTIDWGQLGIAIAFLVGIAVFSMTLSRMAFRKATA